MRAVASFLHRRLTFEQVKTRCSHYSGGGICQDRALRDTVLKFGMMTRQVVRFKNHRLHGSLAPWYPVAAKFEMAIKRHRITGQYNAFLQLVLIACNATAVLAMALSAVRLSFRHIPVWCRDE